MFSSAFVSYCSYVTRSEEHTSELQSQSNLVCRLLLEKKKQSLIHIARVFSAPTQPPRPVSSSLYSPGIVIPQHVSPVTTQYRPAGSQELAPSKYTQPH